MKKQEELPTWFVILLVSGGIAVLFMIVAKYGIETKELAKPSQPALIDTISDQELKSIEQ